MMARRRGAAAEPPNVFVSHSSRDRAFTERLVSVLRRQGVACWYAPTGILGAQQWQIEIGRALRRCNWFVIGNGSVLTQVHWGVALNPRLADSCLTRARTTGPSADACFLMI